MRRCFFELGTYLQVNQMKHANQIERSSAEIAVDYPRMPEQLRPVPAASPDRRRPASPAIGAAVTRHATGALLGLAAAAGMTLALRAAPVVAVGSLAAAIAWGCGWVYLAWALDARTRMAGLTDALLGSVTLVAAVALVAQPAGLAIIFAMHALAAPLRIITGGVDARSWAAGWFVFNGVLGVVVSA